MIAPNFLRIVPLRTLGVILSIACSGTAIAQAEPRVTTGLTNPVENVEFDRETELPEEVAAEPFDAYHIELILFTRRTTEQDTQDREPVYYRRPDQGGIAPGIYDSPTGPLHDELDRLMASPNYEVRAYSSWRQVAARTGASPRVLMGSLTTEFVGWLKVYDNNILLADMDIEFIPGRRRALVIEAIEPVENEATPLLDLPMYEPEGLLPVGVEIPALEPAPEPESRYRINERRRVRFNEQHYFDHPRFGLLLRVERSEITVNETLGIAEEETDEVPTDESLPDGENDADMITEKPG